MRRACAAVLLAALLGVTSPALAQCRQALALGLDVSGSVDATEYRLQLDGVARALLDDQVADAFLIMPDAPVRLMVFEWSARLHQRQIIGWTAIQSREDLARIADKLLTTGAVSVDNPSTAIGAAMLYGVKELQSQAECWQKTLDISGDGPANIGLHPQDIRPEEIGDVVINGLVIGPDAPANINKNRHNLKSLMEYYNAYVLRGFGAFGEPAEDYSDFERAMRRKLIRELQPVAVSALPEKDRAGLTTGAMATPRHAAPIQTEDPG
ncbi:MAG: DUF1194 domain-containing protein [Pseudomonadota bacterium]